MTNEKKTKGRNRITGTLRGRPVKESDLTYDPAGDAYRIRAGDRIVAIRSEALTAGEPLDLDGPLGLGQGGSSDSSSSDPLRARVKAAENMACADMPEVKPCHKSHKDVPMPKVYYHDRFPSMTAPEIVDDAILMLRTKKNLDISLRSFNKEGDDWRLVYEVETERFKTAPSWERKTIECVFTDKAFDRTTSEIDRHAKLKARLDTNTFLKLRIAFLLYEAQKIGKRDYRLVNLDVFRILSISSYPYYQF